MFPSVLRRILACLAVMSLSTEAAWAEYGQLILLPTEVRLSSPEARQTLVVQWDQDGQYLEQQREGVSFASSDEKVVRVENGIAVPSGNGTAEITATYTKEGAALTAVTEVTV